MEYIVTGGAGYIGGHVVDMLVSNKQDVTVIDDMSSGNHVNKKSKFIKFDLRKQFTEYKKLDLESPIIIHLAANPDVKESMNNIQDHYERDVTATLNALELARKLDASKVIFSSTSAVYGNAVQMPTPESYPSNPISNYGMFKVLGEGMLEYYSENYGIKSVALRFANITGGRVSHGIMYNFAHLLKKNAPIEIWGDGKQSKSYIYISDLLNAMMIATNKSKKTFDVFNIGNVDSCSVLEIVEIFMKYAGPGIKANHIGSQAGDVRTMLLDISKISSLGWKPTCNSRQAVSKSFDDLIGKAK